MLPKYTIEINRAFAAFLRLFEFKFNFPGTCYTGLIRQTNLALIIGPDPTSIVPIEALVRFLNRVVRLLCPKNVLKSLKSVQWLGLAWNPN